MEGFECKKCGGENVEYGWTDFSPKGLGKGITHIKCLNNVCENYGIEVAIYKYEIL